MESIFRGDGDKLVFNLMESPDVLMEEGIFHVAFPFGRNWYYYDLREEFRFNLLKYIGRPKPQVRFFRKMQYSSGWPPTNSILGIPICSGSVSYTHLDVYKRQGSSQG